MVLMKNMVIGLLSKPYTLSHKTLISVSLAAMDQSSTSNIDISLELCVDIRDDSRVPDSIGVFDDYIILVTDGVPLNIFRCHGETS